MKTLTSVIAVSTLGLFAVCDLCQPAHSANPALRAPIPELASATSHVEERSVALEITGMTCGGCVIAARKVLARMPGVIHARVRYVEHQAIVIYDPAKVTIEQMIAAIRGLGYSAALTAGDGVRAP